MLKIKRVRKKSWEVIEVNKKVNNYKKEKLEVISLKEEIPLNKKILLDYIYWKINFSDIDNSIINSNETKWYIKKWLVDRRVKKNEYERIKILYISNDFNILPFTEFNASNIVHWDSHRGSPVSYNRNW